MYEHRDAIQAHIALPKLRALLLALPGLVSKSLCKCKYGHMPPSSSVFSLGEGLETFPWL